MDPRDLATVELLGSLAYGQLRSFAAIGSTVALAPDVKTADRLAGWAVEEYGRYEMLVEHLRTRTELVTGVMERQKGYLDAYFSQAPVDSWFGACLFFALGIPIASDFIRAVVPSIDEASRRVVLEALDRERVEKEALRQFSLQLTDDAAREEARALTADLLGQALTGFQAAMSNTDALRILMEQRSGTGQTAERSVKQVALTVLEAHRRRVVALGLEQINDVT